MHLQLVNLLISRYTKFMTRQLPPSELIRTPMIAWPTIGVLAGVYCLWAFGIWVGSWQGFLIVTASGFWAFTPMHDAAHGSASRKSWINTVVGHASALVLNGPYDCFKYVHLTHHRFTNEGEADPDLWAGTGPAWQLPLRWLSQEAHYYDWYFKRWDQRPRRERLSLIISTGLQWILVFTFPSPEIFFYWILPAKLASSLLAFSFDYLPHQPHSIPAKENRYQASHILLGPWLTPIFLFQNYHLIHHLYPGVPFYRYTAIWEDQKDFLISQGTMVYGGVR